MNKTNNLFIILTFVGCLAGADLQLTLANIQPEHIYNSSYKELSSTLKLGSKGSEVIILQDFLRTRGMYNNDSTGYFGVVTRAVVKKYQTSVGIQPTGVVGPITRAAVNKILILDAKVGVITTDLNNKKPVENINTNTSAKSDNDISTLYKNLKSDPSNTTIKKSFLSMLETTVDTAGTELVLKTLKSGDDKDMFNSAIKNVTNKTLENSRYINTRVTSADITKILIKGFSNHLEEYSSRDTYLKQRILKVYTPAEASEYTNEYKTFLMDRSNFRIFGLIDVLVGSVQTGVENNIPDKKALVSIASGEELDVTMLGRRVAMYTLAKKFRNDSDVVTLFGKLALSIDDKVSTFSQSIYKNPEIRNYADLSIGL